MKENQSGTEGEGNEDEKRRSTGGGITIYGSEKAEGRKRRTIMVGLRERKQARKKERQMGRGQYD